MALPMSMDIFVILKCKISFPLHFWAKNDYFSSRWCKGVKILKWIFGLVYFSNIWFNIFFSSNICEFICKIMRRGCLRRMKFGLQSIRTCFQKQFKIVFVRAALHVANNFHIFHLYHLTAFFVWNKWTWSNWELKLEFSY